MDGGSCIVQESVIKTIPKKKEMQIGITDEALQIAEKRREAKGKRKGKIYPFECRVPKNSKAR